DQLVGDFLIKSLIEERTPERDSSADKAGVDPQPLAGDLDRFIDEAGFTIRFGKRREDTGGRILLVLPEILVNLRTVASAFHPVAPSCACSGAAVGGPA